MHPLEKYLNRPNADLPEDHKRILEEGKEIDKNAILGNSDVNQLFNKGYLSGESGYRQNRDGSIYVSVLTRMPKVSIEMIDWWFWWHPAKPIRYQIWYPEMHFDNQADFKGHYDNEEMTYQERLHLSAHLVTEDVGLGKDEILIDFMHPRDFGFDEAMLDSSETTIICARIGSPTKGVWGTRMCHFVRVTDDGVEMRSRFWIGHKVYRMGGIGQNLLNTILNTTFVKKRLIPKNLGPKMFHHCSQEYHNLAEILPELFTQER